jgi:hypothetical protein
MYNCANSILKRCTDASPGLVLENAIHGLREALNRRPTPHPQRLTLMNDLSSALVAKYWNGGQLQDLVDAMVLHMESLTLRTDEVEDVPSNIDGFRSIVRDQHHCLLHLVTNYSNSSVKTEHLMNKLMTRTRKLMTLICLHLSMLLSKSFIKHQV